MAGMMDFLLGGQGGISQAPAMSKPQMGRANVAGQMGLQGLQGLQQNKFNFAPIAQQARTQFQTQTLPGLMERFSSMGPVGSQGGARSSAALGTIGAAGAGLEEALAALKEQYGLQERWLDQNLYQNLFSQGQQPQFQNFQSDPSSGFLQQALLPLLMNRGGGGFSGLLQLLFPKLGGIQAPKPGGQSNG